MKYEIHQCVASRLRRLSRIVDGNLRGSLEGFDITENQMNILFMLSKFGKVEQGTIGKRLVLERSTVSRGVKLLEKQGYVKKTLDYRPEIELTQKGSQLVEKLMPIWEQFMDKICSKVGDEGMELLKNLENLIK